MLFCLTFEWEIVCVWHFHEKEITGIIFVDLMRIHIYPFKVMQCKALALTFHYIFLFFIFFQNRNVHVDISELSSVVRDENYDHLEALCQHALQGKEAIPTQKAETDSFLNQFASFNQSTTRKAQFKFPDMRICISGN